MGSLRGRDQVPTHKCPRSAPREPGDTCLTYGLPEGGSLGTLGLSSPPHVRRAGRTGPFCAPSRCLGKRVRATQPWAQTAAPCLWAGRVELHGPSPPSANLLGGWALGRRGGNPPGTQGPFHGARPSQVMMGGYRGAGQAWAQSLLCPGSSWPTHMHMHKHTALHKPKTHPQQPPTHLHTHANTHLHSLGHSPVYLLPEGSPQHAPSAHQC